MKRQRVPFDAAFQLPVRPLRVARRLELLLASSPVIRVALGAAEIIR